MHVYEVTSAHLNQDILDWIYIFFTQGRLINFLIISKFIGRNNKKKCGLKAENMYRKSSLRSRPCIILNPKFPRLVLEVFHKL